MRIGFVHWCIFGALLANVAVYVWQDRESRTALPRTSEGLRELVLLSELEDEPPPVAGSGSSEEATGDINAENLIKEATDEKVPFGADRPGVEATIAGSSEPVTPPAAGQDAPPESGSPRCWLAGPVADDQVSEALAAHFAAASMSMDLILRTVEADPDHWVHVPTDGSQAEVRRLSRELRQEGLENFPITNGPLAGSLSLGLFRSAEGARGLREDLLNRGYPADIYPRPRYRDEAWIALDDAGREALGWPARVGAVPGFDRVMLEEQSCDR